MTEEVSETFEDASAEGDLTDMDSSRKRKKFHFSVELDSQLLQMVLEDNPYESPTKDRMQCWKSVATKLDSCLGTEGLLPRTCKDRVERLLAYFEEDNPCLKQAGNDSSGLIQHRLALLETISNLRKDVLKDGSSPNIVKRAFRRGTSQLQPRSSSQSATPVTYTYTAMPITGTDEAEIRAAISNGFTQSSSSAEEDGVLIPAKRVEHSNGLDSYERTLVKQLLEARKLEETRRMQELEIRREELQMERMKLDFEKSQWESERKDRDARLALEQEERRALIEFMKKAVFQNPDINES